MLKQPIEAYMYKLADNVEIYEELQENGETYYCVIVYRKGEKEYVINQVIYDFMSYFKEKTTLDSVIKSYGKLTAVKGAAAEQLKKQLTTFLKEIVARHWIIDTNKVLTELNFEPYFKIGGKISEYTVIKLLANNDSTDVYLTRKQNQRKKAVIKVLNSKKFANKKRFERYCEFFQNEFNFLNTFKSIYINKAIAYVKKLDYHYMVLGYIHGENIRRYVRHHKLTTQQKLELIHKMLKGFALIHKKKIYHGDIHFANVIVTPQSQVKIIDFGYSNPAELMSTDREIKPRNGGVHSFIPPERTLRSIKRKFNAVEQYQSEVYQIGLIIYYVFTKNEPFKAETWKTMVDEKRSFNIHEFKPFLNSRMRKSVRRIILKTLENNPEERFDDAQNLLLEWKKIIKS